MMAPNYKSFRHQNDSNTHLKLAGDFDGTSTFELINTIDAFNRRRVVRGIPGAPGIAFGIIALAQVAEPQSIPDHQAIDIAAEEKAFRTAVTTTKQELRSRRERMRPHLPDEVLSLFDAHIMMIESKRMNAGTVARIRNGQFAQDALRDTIFELVHFFEQVDDPYLAARAEDIRNIGRHIFNHLQGTAPASREYPNPCILAGTELSLADISDVPRDRLAGIICMRGSALSHIAIICRALGIPAVMELTDLSISHLEDCEIAVNGNQGAICINPSPLDIIEFQGCMQEEQALAVQLDKLRDLPSQTIDGEAIPLYLNPRIGPEERK